VTEHKKDTKEKLAALDEGIKEKMIKMDERVKVVEFSKYKAIGIIAAIGFFVTFFGGFAGRLLEQAALGSG